MRMVDRRLRRERLLRAREPWIREYALWGAYARARGRTGRAPWRARFPLPGLRCLVHGVVCGLVHEVVCGAAREASGDVT
jgi:hypothetical protein